MLKQKNQYDIIMVIVNHGKADKVVEFSKRHGSHGATIVPGSGTRHNTLLEMLGLNEVRREVVLMVVEHSHTATLLDAVRTELEMDKPGRGIAVAIPVDWAFGIHQEPTDLNPERTFVDHHCYLICTIIDRNDGEYVVELGDKIGINGATLVHGYGAASRGHKIFDFSIEPAKDLVIMIVRDDYENILKYMKDELKLDRPNSGIQFVLPVTHSIGLYHEPDIDAAAEPAETRTEDTKKVALHLITAPNVLDHALQVAEKVGVSGATHIPARGVTSHEALKIFNLPLEPRREWITIIAEREQAEKLATAWQEELAIDAPGQGLVFVTKVLQDTGVDEA